MLLHVWAGRSLLCTTAPCVGGETSLWLHHLVPSAGGQRGVPAGLQAVLSGQAESPSRGCEAARQAAAAAAGAAWEAPGGKRVKQAANLYGTVKPLKMAFPKTYTVVFFLREKNQCYIVSTLDVYFLLPCKKEILSFWNIITFAVKMRKILKRKIYCIYIYMFMNREIL